MVCIRNKLKKKKMITNVLFIDIIKTISMLMIENQKTYPGIDRIPKLTTHSPLPL